MDLSKFINQKQNDEDQKDPNGSLYREDDFPPVKTVVFTFGTTSAIKRDLGSAFRTELFDFFVHCSLMKTEPAAFSRTR